ncbi:MAG: hypothetical protein K2Z80_07715 [Xanthobacteraceae bacterium]|nr:hypothetical protein [Xanthobacteraceae bacterium]
MIVDLAVDPGADATPAFGWIEAAYGAVASGWLPRQAQQPTTIISSREEAMIGRRAIIVLCRFAGRDSACGAWRAAEASRL